MEEEIKLKKCSKCGRELPMTEEYFYINKVDKGGFDTVCKECKGYKFGIHWTKKLVKDGYRICTKCGEQLPENEEYFYKDSKGNFKAICRNCVKNKYKQNDSNFNIEDWYNNRSSKFKNNWKYNDIKWIYDNYLNIGKQELLNHFNNEISYKTLTNIIYQWNIKKINKSENWSEEDINFLKENYPDMEQNKLQEKLKGRTWDAIINKASKLNIKRDEETLFEIKSKCQKGHTVSEEARRKMSQQRRGKNNSVWKGGLTPLHTYFRSILYEWKLDSLKAYDYKCAFTKENNNDLEIHHINENFSDIITKTLNKLNLKINENMTMYSEDELKLINKTFLELHYELGLGVPLKKSIHQLFHAIYGLTNNTKEQFEEFKKRYFNGEFEEQLKITEENLKLQKPKQRKKYKKLNKEKVIKIKDYINRGLPNRYIAKEFNVSEVAIYNIRTNKSWKEVS